MDARVYRREVEHVFAFDRERFRCPPAPLKGEGEGKGVWGGVCL